MRVYLYIGHTRAHILSRISLRIRTFNEKKNVHLYNNMYNERALISKSVIVETTLGTKSKFYRRQEKLLFSSHEFFFGLTVLDYKDRCP